MSEVTLGLRVDHTGAVQALNQFSSAFQKTTQKIEESRGKFDAWQASLTQSVTPVNTLRTANEGLAKAKDGATLSASRLRGGLTTLASSIIGLNPQVSQLSSVIGSFAIGSGLMVGVLGGLAALGLVYNRLTEDSRKFKNATDDLIASLVKQKQAAFDATLAGMEANKAAALLAQTKAQEALRRFDAGGLGLGFTKSRAELVRDYNAATDALDQLNAMSVAKRKEMEDDAAAAQKKHLRELAAQTRKNAAEAEKYLSDLIANAERAASALSQMGYGNFTFSGGFADPEPEYDRTTSAESKAWEDFWQERNRTREANRKLEEDANKKAAEDAKRYATDMKDIWRQGLSRIITDGTRSFRDFFDRVLQMFTRLMARMQEEGKNSGGMYKALGLASSAIGGAFTGYQVGQQVGSAGGGAVAGALGGAVFGAQIAGPIGAVVGGLTGLAAGLLGGAKAAEAAKVALENMRRAVESNIASYEARAYGTAGSLADQIRQTQEEAERQRAEIIAKYRAGDPNRQWYDIGPGMAERDRDLARIDAAEKAYIARLKEEDAIKKTTEAMERLTTSMLNVPAGFKYQSLIYEHSAARPFFPNPPMMPTPYSPQGGPTKTGGDLTVPVILDGTEIGKAVLKNFKAKAQQQFGDTSAWSQIQ